VTPAEAAELLAYAGSLDNRKPSLAAAKAWSDALQDVPLDQDTLAAVARYYSMPATDDPNDNRWLQPHHVRFHRAKIREPRIDAAHPVYNGQPLETGIDSSEGIRALNEAAGDGRIPPRSIADAIAARDEMVPLSPRIRAMIENAGRDIPDEDDPEQPAIGVNARGVRCPICQAMPGKSCRGHRDRTLTHVHPARLDDARRIAEGRAEELARREAALLALNADGPSDFVPPGREGFEPWVPLQRAAESEGEQ
jgi:hypothetical protein